MPRKAGRPPKYKAGTIIEPEFTASHPEKLLTLMEQGLFDYEIAGHFGIAHKTLIRWRDSHEEFALAYEIGRGKRFSWWFQKSRKAVEEGNDKGSRYFTVIMNNMFSNEGIVSQYNKANQQINIGNMNVLNQNASEAELLESIKQNFSRLYDHTQEELKPVLIEYVDDEHKKASGN